MAILCGGLGFVGSCCKEFGDLKEILQVLVDVGGARVGICGWRGVSQSVAGIFLRFLLWMIVICCVVCVDFVFWLYSLQKIIIIRISQFIR